MFVLSPLKAQFVLGRFRRLFIPFDKRVIQVSQLNKLSPFCNISDHRLEIEAMIHYFEYNVVYLFTITIIIILLLISSSIV